jgi:hypothetical protein
MASGAKSKSPGHATAPSSMWNYCEIRPGLSELQKHPSIGFFKLNLTGSSVCKLNMQSQWCNHFYRDNGLTASSHLQAHPRAEPADVVRVVTGLAGRMVEALNLFHDQAGLGGLGVGDVDRVVLARGDLSEFGGEHAGSEVQAARGERLFAVAEGGFDHQQGHRKLVDAGPEGGVALGVAAEHPVAALTMGCKATGGHGVNRREHLHRLAAHRQHLTDLDGAETHERALKAGDAGEIGPDQVVEHMGLQRSNGAGQGVHLQRRRAFGQAARGDRVDHEGQGGDVVEVGMGEQHVVDLRHLIEREVAHAGAGVDQVVGIEQERSGAAVSGDGARAAEDANPHV